MYAESWSSGYCFSSQYLEISRIEKKNPLMAHAECHLASNSHHRVSRNYTKLTMLSFLYCFVVKGKLI